MKKFLVLGFIAASFALAAAPHALAVGVCTVDAGCVNYGAGYICSPTKHTCLPPANQSGCTVDAGCSDYGPGYTCDTANNICKAPAPGTVTPGSTSGNTTTSSASGGFQALAPIPGLTDQQPSNNFGTFLNNLYKFLIGIAAALAIIQIVRGGLNIATQDSAEKHGKGREQITQAILGLVLVLSPVLVFSIINPSILNLNIDFKSLNLSQYKGIYTLPNGVLTPAQQDALPGSTNGNGQFTTNAINSPCDPASNPGSFNCTNANNLCQENTPGGYTADATAVCLSGGQVDSAHPPTIPTHWFGLISGSAAEATTCPVSGDTLAVSCVYSGSGSGPGAYTGH